MGMILAFTRGIRDAVLAQQERRWACRQIRPQLVELNGSTMGIVGMGAVGRALARRACAFDMRVLGVDLYPTDAPDGVQALWGTDRLDDLLRNSDYAVVTVPYRLDDLLRNSDYAVVTVPYTQQSHGMIGAYQLALLKPTAMIVGVSRGGVIDQGAVAEALRSRRLAAAALDVFSPEPLPEGSDLWELDNMLITPHIAGGTQFEAAHVLGILSENLTRLLNGDLPLRNQINKSRGF
jgi:phosphoglycerate dehydrogenase-like enzyme